MSLASVFALAAFVVSVAALVAAFASWAFARPRRGATVHIPPPYYPQREMTCSGLTISVPAPRDCPIC